MGFKRKILVVEDNNLNREILTDILSEKYIVLEAKNGYEALDILRQQPGDIALIMLDVIMPVMDGYEFLDTIKKDPQLSLIPVVVTTQCDGEDTEIKALEHGAVDFVLKPYKPNILLKRVDNTIKLRESAAMINQFRTDRLTGVYSKEYFYQIAAQLLEENPDVKYNIVCSDIENFKTYNNIFGAGAGDKLLIKLAGFLKTRLGNQGCCARFGSDKFVAIIPRSMFNYKKQEATVEGDPDFEAITENIDIKWGIYEIEDRSISIEQMCDCALLAISYTKGLYNKNYAFYDDHMRQKLLREQRITDSMEQSLENGEFKIYLQPKYRINDQNLTGAEALVRWMHPEWGFMSPAEFIPLFEKNGFITNLDRYIWEQACIVLKSWQDRNLPIVPISVNVSRADIYNADLPYIIIELTRKYGVEHKNLHLEITESAYTENPQHIKSTVERLRNMGFIIEVDDFGSGYSSLNMLSQVNMDKLKLDNNFVKSETDCSSKGIINYVIDMAHSLDMKVVAEGVETAEQLETLRKMGCDIAQGYYFAKPMPVEEFEEILKNSN